MPKYKDHVGIFNLKLKSCVPYLRFCRWPRTSNCRCL